MRRWAHPFVFLTMLKLDILIFDIDGVLIDVSESYRDAVRETARLYFEAVMGLSPARGDLVSREDVAAFKLAGGFNNDWDLTTAIVKYFLASLDAQTSEVLETSKVSEILTFLRQTGKQINTTADALRQRGNLQSFADTLRAEGGGLAAARKVLGDRNDHLLFADGDLRATNLVKRIFEEVYLGEELFRAEYGEAPLVYHGTGLIQRERLILNLQSLIALSQRAALGIATGRPRSQAVFALKTAGILDHFRSLVTLEDIVAAEQKLYQASGKNIALGKPHPFALWEAVQRITAERVRCAYVGDTPDDIRAANAAKSEMDFISIGCLASVGDKEQAWREFERIGADVIVEHPDELVDVIEKKT